MTDHLHDLPSDAHTVLLTGAKGGVGTSTVAALHALALARAGFSTTLTGASDTELADLAGILGIPTPERPGIDVNAVAGLTPSPTASAYIVIDGGTATAPDVAPTEHYLVTRPCYLALKRALASQRRPDGVVVLLEPERSLTRSDIEDVLGVRVVATMAVQPATARLIDAGLLATQRRGRLPLVWVD